MDQRNVLGLGLVQIDYNRYIIGIFKGFSAMNEMFRSYMNFFIGQGIMYMKPNPLSLTEIIDLSGSFKIPTDF